MKTVNRAVSTLPDPLRIEIDSLPIDLNPLTTCDYTSKYISSVMYEPLRNGYNSRINHQNNQDYTIQLHPNYLGNAYQLANTIQFHLKRENQSPHVTSFLSVKHAIPFVKKQLSFDEIGIRVKDDRELEVVLDEPFEGFLSILQSSFFIPSEQNGQPVANGPYQLTCQHETGLHFERNPRYQMTPADKNTIHSIDFVLNKNLSKSIDLYKTNHIDITCHTQFHHDNMEYQSYKDFKESSLPMLFTLKIKDDQLLTFIKSNLNKNKMAEKLRDIIIPTDSLLGIYQADHSYEEAKLVREESVRMTYADYYPNGEIIQEMISLLDNSGVKTDIHKVSSFYDYYHLDKSAFDIELHLFLPTYLHYTSYAKYFIHDLPDKESKIKVVESIKKRKKKELYATFENTKQYYPICFGKSLFLQNPCIEGFAVNYDGLLSVHDLKCRQ
ncbi:ABC transporter substrate-binding protein [Bacillus changyiensis]|uniref:ABC transporter substrate-binding protein n=1 Tax=Bacillus changyiensis TaxID=3004103 RepID=UPI0022E320D4|nr:ABC transporter substrate-binding protein [Bacillus changyiensis]MDA1476984.1 ABC transporter substrate-binding protein [Bacillus changyiensis]